MLWAMGKEPSSGTPEGSGLIQNDPSVLLRKPSRADTLVALLTPCLGPSEVEVLTSFVLT